MTISNDHTLKAVNSEVLKLIYLFQMNPFRYLYESDIQCDIFSRLREAIPSTLTIAGEGACCKKSTQSGNYHRLQ